MDILFYVLIIIYWLLSSIKITAGDIIFLSIDCSGSNHHSAGLILDRDRCGLEATQPLNILCVQHHLGIFLIKYNNLDGSGRF